MTTFTYDGPTPTLDASDHQQRRRLRWRRRSRARALAYAAHPGNWTDDTGPLRRLKHCGLAVTPEVTINYNAGHAHATGLRACGNIWTCATCSARIRARRETEIEAALLTHCQAGGGIGLLTLTLQHHRSMPLAETLTALNAAWRRLQQQRAFRTIRRRCAGFIATVEITHGDNGWHPHLHIILAALDYLDADQLRDELDSQRPLWSRFVNAITTRHTLRYGLDFTWLGHDATTAATYVTKLAKEVTLTDTKSGTDALSLLDRDDPEAVALFYEYADATYRRQCHRWSAHLRQALLPNTPELTDEELADDNRTVGTVVLVIEASAWNRFTETERLGWIELVEAQQTLAPALYLSG